MSFDGKVEWLKRYDRNPELHRTIKSLMDSLRIPEAVLLLEAHIAGPLTSGARWPAGATGGRLQSPPQLQPHDLDHSCNPEPATPQRLVAAEKEE